ncbi:MAG: hypothetical protein FIB05_09445 [Betaproteobacteria bacterium]|nr:hypothetical protein [Betaproteobacteria bacterium]
MSVLVRRGLAALAPLVLLASTACPAWAQGGVAGPGYAVPLMADPGVSLLRVPPPPETRLLVEQGLVAVQATLTVNYLSSGTMFQKSCTPWSAQAQAAFSYAASLWAAKVQSSIPITINACWAVLDPGVLGAAGPASSYRDFAGAPVAGTWYPIALANALAGTDLNGSGSPEINAQFGSTFNWYLGTDGNTPISQYDFVSVVMHELGHGLGFLGSMNVSGGVGSWGGGSGFPYIYDRFTENGSNQALITAFANSSAALATQLTSNNIFFDGTNSRAANGNAAVPLYAPAAWSGGSSYSHLAESFNGTPNALMTFSLANGESIHDPGPVALGILKDSGWALETVVVAPGSLSLNLAATASSIAVTSGSTTFSVSRTSGTSGAVSGNLGVTGGCTLSTGIVSFASGSTTPSPASVTVFAGSAVGGATCTVSLVANAPATTGTPSAAAIGVVVPDTTPSAFGFTSQSGVVPETQVTSNTITPVGYNVPAAISVANGTYSIGCAVGGFTSAAGTISPGQSVCVRHTASASFGATNTTTLTVGGVAGTFSTTTVASLGTALANGVALSGLSGAAGASAYYYIDVPAGATSLTVATTTGGRSTDLSLYVRRDGVPTTLVRDCASATAATTAETCSFTNPPAGRYYILLLGAAPAGYSGVGLLATYVASAGSPGSLSMNLTGTAASIAAGTGSTAFAVARTGGTSGAATGNLTVIGGCTLSTSTVSFANGSSTPSPATVTLSAGSAAGGGSCTVGMSATGATLSTSLPVGFMVTITGGTTPPPPSATALSNGVPVGNLSGASGSSVYYYIDVPTGATSLAVQTSGGSGDADLFVKLGAQPTTGTYDCGSTSITTAEGCSFTNPVAGRYYVLLYGYAAYSGVTLQASYVAPAGSPGTLSLNLSGTAASISAGTGSTTFAVARTGGTTGAATGNLTVIGGCTLSTSTVNFASGSSTPSPATVTLSAGSAVGGGSCTVGMSATGATLSTSLPVGFMVTIAGTAPPPAGTALSNGVPVGNLSGATGSSTYFYIDVPSGATSLVVQTAGGSGARGDTSNANLYVRRDAAPTTGVFDCASTGATSAESCSFTNPAAGRYHILLYGAAAFTGASVQATFVVTVPTPGALALSMSSASMPVTTGTTTFSVSRTGGTTGAATGTLGIAGGCTLSASTVSFASGSAAASPASVTVSAGSAVGGGTCTVTLTASGASLGSPSTLAISITAAPPPPSGTALANGVPVGNLSGATGSSAYFYIDVPASSSLVIQTAGGSGGRGDTSNVNLYVSRNTLPTPTTYECASTGATSAENCTYISPPAARYHILLYGAAAYTGASVQATYVALTGSPGALSLNLSGTAGSIAAGTGSTTFAVARTGGTAGPATGSLSVIGGCTLSTSSVTFADGSATPSPALVTLYAGTAAGGGSCSVGLSAIGAGLASGAPVGFSVTITGTTTPPPPAGTALSNGVPVGNLAGALGSSAYYYIDVPTGATSLAIQTSGGSGDMDLLVKLGTQPTTSSYDCVSASLTATEACSFTNPVAGRYHVMLYGFSAYSGVTLQATYVAGTTPPPTRR